MDNESGVSASKKMRRDMGKEKDELRNTARDQLVEKIIRQQQEIDGLLLKQANENGLDELRESVDKMKLQVAESNRQENMLMKRLATKEREVQELIGQISELKQAMNPSSAQLQSMLLDPAINLLYIHMKKEMDSNRSQLEQSQKDLAAWKFTPDSQTGKRLMAKCRMLLQENEELGRTVSSGRLAKLEGDIALQKRLILEMKNSEKDTEEFLGDVDEDLEAMQSTVYLLQQQLKDAKDRIVEQQQEIDRLRTAATGRCDDGLPPLDRKSSLTVESASHTTMTDKRDLKTVATSVVDTRTKPSQNYEHVAAVSLSDQKRQIISQDVSPERMEVCDVRDQQRNGKLNCTIASRSLSAVHSGPDAHSVTADDVQHRSTCRTAAKQHGNAESDLSLSNGMDENSRRASVDD